MKLLDTSSLDWVHFTGGDRFDYPIDYWASVLNTRADGHIDMLFRWEPSSYCHFHRHLVDATTTVLKGEHHVIEIKQGKEVEHKVRLIGDYAHKPAGDAHMEYAGPTGSLLLFNMYAPDGQLFEILDKDENVIAPVSTEDIMTRRLAR
jgi:quercetin dioxygenase-like cupin family protein